MAHILALNTGKGFGMETTFGRIHWEVVRFLAEQNYEVQRKGQKFGLLGCDLAGEGLIKFAPSRMIVLPSGTLQRRLRSAP